MSVLSHNFLILSVVSFCLFLSGCDDGENIEVERARCMQLMQITHGHLWGFVGWGQLDQQGFPDPTIIDKQNRQMWSWRFEVFSGIRSYCIVPPPNVPWLEKQEAYKPWSVGGQYEIPGFKARRTTKSDESTDFLAIVGPGTAFTEFAASKQVSTSELSAIEPDAILLVECDSPFHVIEPGDLSIDEIRNSKSKTGLGVYKGNFPGCFAVCFVDGTVWFLKETVPKKELLKLMTVESAKQHDREEVLGKYVIQRLPPSKDYKDTIIPGQ